MNVIKRIPLIWQTVGGVGSLIVVITAFATYHSDFVTQAEASDLAKIPRENRGLIQGLTKEFRVSSAFAAVDRADQKLYFHERDEQESGATAKSAERRHELENIETRAQKYLDCLIQDQPNCELLKPTAR